MKKLTHLLVFATLLACNKDPEPEKEETPKKIYFTGITESNDVGIIARRDTTDWRFNDTWVEQEAKLFPTAGEASCTQAHNHNIFAFPNPNKGLIKLNITKLQATQVQIRLVDKEFKVILSRDSIPNGINIFDLTASAPKDTLRLYYKFIDGSCVYKGHGDILVNE
ncbi:hypothetical protein [Siphonobacter sp. SORGH_AS_0500]|uniref:hypothetical protein n=1 Tax=Siphonobacter sp. SORGH_AS_0500 TaxID=1864824 RepID=UPI00285A26C6|nr:hypothetical protein [Siphonobacter sp. SORGH_AS_0500]MDR6193880.1 hypothetical protein [Siphonobacter sp. SORGH_AS_0500]